MATSSSVAPSGKLQVLLMLLSTKAWIAACMRTWSSARDVAAHDKGVAHRLGQVGDILARAVGGHVLANLLLARIAQVRRVKRLLEERAGVDKLHVAVAILEVADVAQRKDRLAAVALHAADRGDGARGRNRRLRRVADAVVVDAVRQSHPSRARGAASRG